PSVRKCCSMPVKDSASSDTYSARPPRRAASAHSWFARIVLPLPGGPCTTYVEPLHNPPPRMAPSPHVPVDTRSGCLSCPLMAPQRWRKVAAKQVVIHKGAWSL